jgi:two-component system chemotaxis response regulator CheY
MRNAFQTLLAPYHFKVHEVASGREAMDECQRNIPDFILLSSAMPDMDGLEFLRNLRDTESGRRVVVLFCSANSSAEDLGQAIYKGAEECLMKPFDADLLDYKLRQIGALPPYDALDMAA